MACPNCLATTLSLIMLATPARACDDLPIGQSAAGFPCANQTVAQDRDLNFSIRSSPSAASQPGCGQSPAGRPAITIGSGIKADALIFFRSARQGKEVSDAPAR
jgi:hypothetical protein